MGCGTTQTGSTIPDSTNWSPPGGTIYFTGQKSAETGFAVTGTSPGTGNESFNTQDDTGQGNNCWAAGSGSVTVQGPTSTTVSSLTPLSITLLFPSLETGIGAVATLTVGAANGNWDNKTITESLSTTSNQCPVSWPAACSGSSSFTVGAGGQASVNVNGVPTLVGPVFVGQHNTFYDQHTYSYGTSLLDAYEINSCTEVCGQNYYFQGNLIDSHAITYSFIKAKITGTNVTSTEVSEQ
jgi:hypothetical protein